MENAYVEKAYALRNHPTIRYNCAQSVLIPFAKECEISEEKAFLLGNHFAGGMKMASVCGAITGGLMVLGMCGCGDEEQRAFMAAIKGKYEGMVNCSDLLQRNAQLGGKKKPHCDAVVYEAVGIVAELLGQQ